MRMLKVRHAAGVGAFLVFALLAQGEVRWTVTVRDEGSAKFVSATARNEGSEPALLGRYKISEEVVKLGPEAVALLMSGWQGPSIVRQIRGEQPLVSKTLVQLFDGKAAWHAGFITFDRVSTEHEIRWDEARKAAVVTSFCDFDGYRLAPAAE